MYTQLVQRLIDGITLSAEDLIDLFSLKLNEKDHASHFSSALDILIRAKVSSSLAYSRVLNLTKFRAYQLEDETSHCKVFGEDFMFRMSKSCFL